GVDRGPLLRRSPALRGHLGDEPAVFSPKGGQPAEDPGDLGRPLLHCGAAADGGGPAAGADAAGADAEGAEAGGAGAAGADATGAAGRGAGATGAAGPGG